MRPANTDHPHVHKFHPLPVRIMHWINAVAIFIMIGSGWKIYNDEVIFGWLHFPEWLTIGKWAQHGLQWHFFGMWIFVLNGVAFVTYGLATGRFRRNLLPIYWSDLVATIKESLRLHLAHDDLTKYNAVQKILYIGVMCVGASTEHAVDNASADTRTKRRGLMRGGGATPRRMPVGGCSW